MHRQDRHAHPGQDRAGAPHRCSATIRKTLKFAYLNSHFQTGLINLLDRAVLEHVELQSSLRLSQDYHKVDEIPFDFERRRMSVVVSEREDHHELICKGR